MKKILYGILFMLMISTALNAVTITTKQPACISEKLLERFSTALLIEDKSDVFQLILHSNCFMLKPGQKVSIIERGVSLVKLRLHYDDGTFEVVAPIEAIK